MRQFRINALDKKPDKPLLIGPQSSLATAVEDAHMLEDLLKKPDKSAEESRDVGLNLPGQDAFLAYIKQDYRKVPNKTLGQILITNGIKDPISGNDFYISPVGTVLIRNTKSATAKNRTYLSELLRKEYKPGFIN